MTRDVLKRSPRMEPEPRRTSGTEQRGANGETHESQIPGFSTFPGNCANEPVFQNFTTGATDGVGCAWTVTSTLICALQQAHGGDEHVLESTKKSEYVTSDETPGSASDETRARGGKAEGV